MRLTDDQRSAASSAYVSVGERTRVAHFTRARLTPTAVHLPELGRVAYARPALVLPRPRSIRLIETGDSHVVEFTVRSLHSRITSFRLISLVMLLIAAAVTAAAATTRDRDWWMDAFSRLGVFDDFSSLAFNAGLIAAGSVVAIFAHRLHLDLSRLRRRGGHRAAPVVLPTLVLIAGTGIAMVGVFTESANRLVHDIGALSMAASYLGLLASSPWLLRGVSARLHLVTGLAALIFAASVIAFVAGTINLALFEFVMFGLFFVWLGVASRDVHRKLNPVTAAGRAAPRR